MALTASALLIVAGMVIFNAIRSKRMSVPPLTQEMDVHVHRLPNGLTIFLTENHADPTVHAEIVVRAGSKHDPVDATGLAHFLEHLLFKGSASLGTIDADAEQPYLARLNDLFESYRLGSETTRPSLYEAILAASREADRFAIPNELSRVYESLGASDMNAYTSLDATVYEIEVPANRLEQWAMLEADRFRHPRFRLFLNELQVVLEEKYEELDSDVEQLRSQVDATLAGGHPYGRSTLGSLDHLRYPSLKAISDFYAAQYVPGNMAIIMSGDIDPRSTIALLEKYFSAWEARPLPAPPVWQESVPEGPATVTMLSTQKEPFVLIGFRTPPASNSDAPVIGVIDLILQNSDSGLLDDNLSTPGRVRTVTSFVTQHHDYGVQYLKASPNAGQSLNNVADLVLAQLDLVKRGAFGDDLLRTAILQSRTALISRLETNAGRVSLIRESFLERDVWRPLHEQFEQIRTVTKHDVGKVASQYFGNRLVMGYLQPGQRSVPDVPRDKLPNTSIDVAERSAFAERVLAMPVPDAPPITLQEGREYRKLEYAPGSRLYYVHNPFNSLFQFTISVETGAQHDSRWPVIEDLWEWADTPSLLQYQLDRRLLELGTDLSVSASGQKIRFVLSGTDEHFSESHKLMMDWISRPRSTPSRLEDVIEYLVHDRQYAQRDPWQILTALHAYNTQRERSLYLRALSYNALKALTVDELVGLMRGVLSYEHTMTYSGSLSPEELVKILRRHHRPHAPLAPTPAYQPYRMEAPDRSVVMAVDQKLIQAHVLIELPADPINPIKHPVVLLFNEYFSVGMDSLIFQRIREALGAVYSVSASYGVGPKPQDESSVIIGFSCQAEKASAVINAVRALLAEVPQSKKLFKETKHTLVSKLRYRRRFFRNIPDAVQAWETRGYERDPIPDVLSELDRLELDDLQDFYRRHVSNKAAHISIVGDLDKVALEQIANVDSVHKLTLKDIFVK